MDAPAWEYAGEEQSTIHEPEAEGIWGKDEAKSVHACCEECCQFAEKFKYQKRGEREKPTAGAG